MAGKAGKVVIHTASEIAAIRRAAALTAQVREQLIVLARPGMSTGEFDMLAGRLIRETGGTSAFFNYFGYPGQICISLDDEVVHGIGRPDRYLTEDSVISIDMGVAIDGGIGDTAITFCLNPNPPADVKRLLTATQQALMAGIKAARNGNHVRDISSAIAKIAAQEKLGIVRDYVGHGCGTKLHEPPEIPNFVTGSPGAKLVPGMVLAIEPMFNLGSGQVKVDRSDGWTVRTADGKLSAHFEHTILITENEPEILTWPKTM